MELCSHGSLKQFLITNMANFHGMDDSVQPESSSEAGTSGSLMAAGCGAVKINILNLFGWCVDVAKGMDFVSRQNVSNCNYNCFLFFSCIFLKYFISNLFDSRKLKVRKINCVQIKLGIMIQVLVTVSVSS